MPAWMFITAGIIATAFSGYITWKQGTMKLILFLILGIGFLIIGIFKIISGRSEKKEISHHPKEKPTYPTQHPQTAHPASQRPATHNGHRAQGSHQNPNQHHAQQHNHSHQTRHRAQSRIKHSNHPTPNTQQGHQGKFPHCPHCGKPVTHNGNYCIFCGNKIR